MMKDQLYSSAGLSKALTGEQFKERMLKLVPDAVDEIREMLISFDTPASVKAKLIEMVLKYGLGDAVDLRGDAAPDGFGDRVA